MNGAHISNFLFSILHLISDLYCTWADKGYDMKTDM